MPHSVLPRPRQRPARASSPAAVRLVQGMHPTDAKPEAASGCGGSFAVERLQQSAERFVITRGAKGALTFDGETLTEIPPHRVQAVDSNGAGDMFAGAFLYAITRGEDFPTAGRFASLAAGRIVAHYGPRLPAADYRALRAEFFGA